MAKAPASESTLREVLDQLAEIKADRSATVSGTVIVANLPTSQPITGNVTVSDGGSSVTVDGSVNVAGTVAVSNFPVTQPVSGTVAVSNFPASQPVTGTFWQATQPVSGTVAVSNFPASQAVTGPLTDIQLRATAVPVSGTFWPATQPVSGPLTDAQLRASAVPVSIGAANISQLGGQAIDVGVGTAGAGTLRVTLSSDDVLTVGQGSYEAGSTPWRVFLHNGTDAAAIRTGSSAPAQTDAALVVTQRPDPRTVTMKTGSLVSTAVTADQVILTYTVTAGKTFWLEYVNFFCRLTTFAATATNFGTASLESPGGTKLITMDLVGTGAAGPLIVPLAPPLPFAAGTVVRVVCTPSATTSFTWRANFGGYEQ